MTTEEILSQFEVYSTTNSSSSEVVITNSVKIAFFDWDNTLFCTDYLAKFNINYKDIFSFQGNLNEINADLNYQLILLQESILKLFSKLIEDHFTIFIISNADLKWIQNCLEHFLCELKDFIEINNIQIYSAKNLFSTNTSSCKWKIKCFKKVLIENCEFIFGKNIIVLCIGDSKEEQKAAIELRKVKFFEQQVKVTFIRMLSSPSILSLIKQHQCIGDSYNNVIENREILYKVFINYIEGSYFILPKMKRKKSENETEIKLVKDLTKKKRYNGHQRKV